MRIFILWTDGGKQGSMQQPLHHDSLGRIPFDRHVLHVQGRISVPFSAG